VQRGEPVFTTGTDPAATRPADLVNRQLRAGAPNRHAAAPDLQIWLDQRECSSTPAAHESVLQHKASASSQPQYRLQRM
jgi:hypothetical protein